MSWHTLQSKHPLHKALSPFAGGLLNVLVTPISGTTAQTIYRVTILTQKIQIKPAVSTSHGVRTTGQLVLALTQMARRQGGQPADRAMSGLTQQGFEPRPPAREEAILNIRSSWRLPRVESFKPRHLPAQMSDERLKQTSKQTVKKKKPNCILHSLARVDRNRVQIENPTLKTE